jgi:transposase
MRRFVEGVDRSQTTLFPESLEDWVDENNPVRVIDAFVDALDLRGLGFDGVVPDATGRPSYHPAVLLKLYISGYLNRVQSSRRLEREAGRNVELNLNPAMRQRREVVEHPFGTIKLRMGATHFLMKTLPKVASEMALHVLAYNLTRVLNILGIQPLMAALRA